MVPRIRDRLLEPGGIVGKLERIDGGEFLILLDDRPRVEEQCEIFVGAEPPVVIALRTDIVVPLELLPDIGVIARLTLLPGVLGDLETLGAGATGGFLLTEPSHAESWGGPEGTARRATPRQMTRPSARPRPSEEIRTSKPTESQLISMKDPP